MRRTLQGDGQAFSRLVDRYQYAVYGICLSLVGDFDAAEDAAQEAFIKAYLHLEKLDSPARFGNWLRIIAVNECRLYLRRVRFGRLSVDQIREAGMGMPDCLLPADRQRDLQEQRAVRERLEAAALQALSQLSERNRQALTLYYLGGHTAEEVAGFLGTSAPAVKMRLHRARKQLQKEAFKMVRTTLKERELRPDLKDRVRLVEATPLFSDIAGFSSIMDVLSAEEMVGLLNEYLTEMTEIVQQHGGTVDKYEGDAIVAFWDGGDHAVQGCLAALDMQARLAGWQEAGKPELSVCYGLNSGQILLGEVGSGQLRNETIMGDPVNLAARLERENRRYGTHILIGESTRAEVGEAVEVRELDRLRLPRRAGYVTVYEVLARKGELPAEKARAVDRYRQGLEQYRERNWGKAIECFTGALNQEPGDGPARLLRKRCEILSNEPPEWLTEDWDGVFSDPEQRAAQEWTPCRDPETLRQQVRSFIRAEPELDGTGSGFEERINAAMAPAVIRKVVRHPELLGLGGTEAGLTVFFSDIVEFTSVIENLSAEETVGLLDEYLSEMTEIVLRYEGTVDKYEGDAVVAFWGAPVPVEDHAVRGCLAALDMQAALAGWREAGKPELKVGCGLNTGPAVVGNLGSRQKMDYTVMGRHVNLGARAERLTREYGVRILVTGNTYAFAGNAVETRELDTVRVYGHGEPVKIYEVLARKGELEGVMARVVGAFARGIEHYEKRDWRQALAAFDEALGLDPDDGPSRVYKARCETFLTRPPAWLTPEWDGIFRW